MPDHETTVADLRRRVAVFVAARDWEQFHTPKNLSASIAIESAELLERFQWLTDEQAKAALEDEEKLAAVADEMADVVIYALSLANALSVGMRVLAQRHPLARCRDRGRPSRQAHRAPVWPRHRAC